MGLRDDLAKPVPADYICVMAHHPLRDFVDRHQRLFVLTGAGCSTNSGIPDYREESMGWGQALELMPTPPLFRWEQRVAH